MQIALHPMQAVAKNTRLANLVSNILYPDSCSPSYTNPQAPLQQQYKSVKNPDKTPQHTADPSCLLQRNGYSIHLVNSLKQRIKASTLIKRMYASRGYQTEQTSVFGTKPNQYTFEARQSGRLIGTLTLTIDTGKGLLADTLYKTELDQFRQQGRTLCEVSKLAFNPETSSKEIFASLFHMAYIFARRVHGADDAFIEINPRHAVFYKRMLGFKQTGEQRTCPRVDAPAVLLQLSKEYIDTQITMLAGRFDDKVCSIYPYFLSKSGEEQVFSAVQQIKPDTRLMA
ncbi:long-chain N-acyl amino acid synthase [Nitrosomonas sp.]|uniref:N-acyl amino acid synthase FeeM domain-containing protein n=1 Tax=Nitrosomonas sp. TaxID=42353 RepID=UPI002632EC89|nr:long-chain N-acyl amino acid synthase [Nitrosomonas sp.]